MELRRFQRGDGRIPYSDWLAGLDDRTAARIAAHVDRMRNGNFADSKRLGDGLSELKIDLGPGFRVYYSLDGKTVILLMGGDKSSQKADIRKAKGYAADYRSRS